MLRKMMKMLYNNVLAHTDVHTYISMGHIHGNLLVVGTPTAKHTSLPFHAPGVCCRDGIASQARSRSRQDLGVDTTSGNQTLLWGRGWLARLPFPNLTHWTSIVFIMLPNVFFPIQCCKIRGASESLGATLLGFMQKRSFCFASTGSF